MKKYLFALLFISCVCVSVFANETSKTEEEENVELNVFGFPDKSFVKLIENKNFFSPSKIKEKPDCNDKILIQKAQKTVAPFIKSSSSSIFNKRRNILITKNINNFAELNVDEVVNMNNRIIKARMTEL